MKELIKLNPENPGNPVPARELYEWLGYEKANWKRWYTKNILKNEFAIKNQDWEGFIIEMNGNKTQEFALSIDFAKRLSMVAKTAKGEEARNYFLECEKIAIESKNINPNQKRINKLRKDGKSDKFIGLRLDSVERRKSFTGVLKNHGVNGFGYQMCTRAIYAPLFGGDGSSTYIKEKYEIGKTKNLRDNLDAAKLTAITLAELLAEEKIEKEKLKGNVACADACRHTGKAIANGIIQARRI